MGRGLLRELKMDKDDDEIGDDCDVYDKGIIPHAQAVCMIIMHNNNICMCFVKYMVIH